jgi:hypothetical protein
MTRYMLSVHTGNAEPREPMSAEEWRQGYEQIGILEAEMRAQDALVYSGRLGEPDSARVVRPSKGRVRMTDGPYAETKEHLGGFYIIDSPDQDAALRWAEKVTLLINEPIEVRAFVEEPARSS